MATKHLRPSRLDEQKRDKLISGIEADRKRLNDAVAGLASPAIGIAVEDVETLRKVSHDWLAEYLQQNFKSFTEASGFVPAATRARVKQEYDDTGRMAEPFCRDIQTIVEKWHFIPIKRDSKGHFWFDEKTVKAWATEQATRHFTEAQQEYYTRLGQLCELLNDVADFERQNGIKPFALHGKQIVTPDGVYHRGLDRYFSKCDEYGHPVGDKMEITPERYINLIDREGLFPAK